jgi:hypothetical protein
MPGAPSAPENGSCPIEGAAMTVPSHRRLASSMSAAVLLAGGIATATPAAGAPSGVPVYTMTVLRSLPLPGVDHASGSIAFDGRSLYYGPAPARGAGPERTVFRRVDASTGRELAAVVMPLRGVTALHLDLRRGTFLAQVFVPAVAGTLPTDKGTPASAAMYEVDLRRGVVTPLFALDPQLGASPRIGYDATTGHFVIGTNEDNKLAIRDRRGRLLSSCTLPMGQGGRGIASLVSAGNGDVFVQVEDDETVLHVDEACQLHDIGSHPIYSEAFAENDQLACDTVTFRRPAIWLRDIRSGSADGATAYAVPDGYCPLPTRTVLAATSPVVVGQSTSVCATVSLAAAATPLRGLPIQLRIGGTSVAIGRTDSRGRACAPWRPTVAGAFPAQVRFAGDVSYLASSATGQVRGLPGALPPNVAPPQKSAAAPGPANAPPPAPAPHTQPVPQAQPQPQPQPQPQGAPQGQPMAVAVPQAQPQVQVQTQSHGQAHRERAMTRRPSIGEQQLAGGALLLGLVGALAMAARPRFATATHGRGGQS